MKQQEEEKGKWLSKADIILALAVLLIAGAFFLWQKTGNRETGAFVRVQIGGNTVAEYPLSKDTEVAIDCGNGTNVLVIKDGKAFVQDADCPDKICVDHKPVSAVGDTIICLPHKLVLQVAE